MVLNGHTNLPGEWQPEKHEATNRALQATHWNRLACKNNDLFVSEQFLHISWAALLLIEF